MEHRNISELRNWDQNPRAIKKDKFEELKTRIKRFDQFKPLIITPDGEVLGGNMRLRAYQELGIQDVWVSVVHPKTEAEKIEIALTDNEEMGYYEDQALAELIDKYKDEIKLGDYSIHLGEPISLEDLLAKFGPEPVEDEVPEVTEEAVSVLGEVYQLGRHRVMCGDSTKIEDVEKLMDGKKADMVFTDPPYGVDYEEKNNEVLGNKSYSKISNDGLKGDGLLQFFREAFSNISLSIKDGAAYYFTAPQGGDQMMMMMMMMKEVGIPCRHELIWIKPSPVFSMNRLDYDYQHEPILYGWKGSHQFFGNGQHTKSIWHVDRESDKSHPTMKPVALVANAISNSSKGGDLVIDLFLGSGSTLIACEQTNRTCYGMELDPKYVDVIRKRYAKFIGKEQEWQTATPALQPDLSLV
jgi:DNA modification methylase